MNKSYYSIPKILEGKTIAFTGIYPGVGKTYTKNELVKQLKENGYRVYNTGTTQKASIGGITVAKQSLNRKDEWKVKSKHVRSNGFYVIDEAFMMDQQTLDNLKEAYPQCCFILFGDPMQFEPASGNAPITNIDLLFNLNKMMRCKDKDLIEALNMLKNGDLPIEFMYKHCDNNIDDGMLVIGYTKAMSNDYSNQFEDTPYKTLYRSMQRNTYEDEFGEEHYSVFDEVFNGDMWRLLEYNKDTEQYTLERISGERKVITISKDIFINHFYKRNCINNHKIQGDTIRSGNDVIVWLDEFIVHQPQSVLRHLYVAFSRVEYSSQIHMCVEQVNALVKSYVKKGPLHDYLSSITPDQKIETSSSELCASNILKTITDNICNMNQMCQLFAVYKGEKCAHLVQGHTEEQAEMTQNTVNIICDRYKSNELQNELDKRLIQEIPGKGKCFITVNKTNDGTNHKDKVEEYNWFVFEIDEIDGEKVSPEQIERLFLKRENAHKPILYPEAKKHSFRIIYSGNKSYHFWIYVDNEELNQTHSRELYKAVHDYLNNKLFNGWADKSIATPEHYVRAPKCIRPDTGKEQTLVSFKGKKTLHIDNIMSLLPEPEEPIIVVQPSKDGSVEQAFELYKNDIPTTNGGRGKKILSKLYKEYYRGFLTKEQLKDLARMLCEHANCPEKIKHMISYINEM
jgi:Viral (Superfamily 1) RNA helicase.